MKLLSLLCVLLFINGCTTQHRHVFIHLGDIDEDMISEHVQYQDGTLIIDNKTVPIPGGDKLSVRYSIKGESVSYTIKVDGKIVAQQGSADSS